MSSPSQPFLDDIVEHRRSLTTTNSTSSRRRRNTLRITLVSLPATSWRARDAFTCPLPHSFRSIPTESTSGSLGGAVTTSRAGPNSEVLIKENPNYPGERPHHFDEIHYGIGLPLETIKLQIDQGATDWGDIPPAAHAELGMLFGPCTPGSSPRPRYLCYPAPTVLYLAMNHDRPLFGDDPTNGPGLDSRGNVRLKQAVNHAIDRIARSSSAALRRHCHDQHMPARCRDSRCQHLSGPGRLARPAELAGLQHRLPTRQGDMYCSNREPAPRHADRALESARDLLEMEIRLFLRATIRARSRGANRST